jgi:hypothetical protein
MKRELRALGKGAEQHQKQRRQVQPVCADAVAGRQHVVEVEAADDVANQQRAAEQCQTAGAGDRQRHTGTFARVLAPMPVADQQEARHAGQLPEHDQKDQVVGQHDAQHRAHEEQQEGEEARRRIAAVEVVSRVQDDQRADAEDQQREQPRQTVDAETESEPELRHPVDAPTQHLAGEHRRPGRRHQDATAHRHRARDPRRKVATFVGQRQHDRSAREGQQRENGQQGHRHLQSEPALGASAAARKEVSIGKAQTTSGHRGRNGAV